MTVLLAIGDLSLEGSDRGRDVAGLLQEAFIGPSLHLGQCVENVGRWLLDSAVLELAQVSVRDIPVGGLLDLTESHSLGRSHVCEVFAQRLLAALRRKRALCLR